MANLVKANAANMREHRGNVRQPQPEHTANEREHPLNRVFVRSHVRAANIFRGKEMGRALLVARREAA